MLYAKKGLEPDPLITLALPPAILLVDLDHMDFVMILFRRYLLDNPSRHMTYPYISLWEKIWKFEFYHIIR